MVKVRNMVSLGGNKVANQFIIEADGNTYFQSYSTIIVKIEGAQTYLDKVDWKYSTTTSKYRNMFLDETTKETQTRIDSGEYKLIDLN